jgi:hypothetical protein
MRWWAQISAELARNGLVMYICDPRLPGDKQHLAICVGKLPKLPLSSGLVARRYSNPCEGGWLEALVQYGNIKVIPDCMIHVHLYTRRARINQP